MQLITITEAATITGKSIQTIRRMIKQKKIRVKRQKTPQGFIYNIIKESLMRPDGLTTRMNIQQHQNLTTQDDLSNQLAGREHRPINSDFEAFFKSEIGRFNTTIQKLIEQHEYDKTNFFQLIKTFQDRVLSLENHIKMLEAPKSKWWQFWK